MAKIIVIVANMNDNTTTKGQLGLRKLKYLISPYDSRQHFSNENTKKHSKPGFCCYALIHVHVIDIQMEEK